MKVELQQRNHQFHHLLGVLYKTLFQLFGIAHLEVENKQDTGCLSRTTGVKLALQLIDLIVSLLTNIWQAVAFSSSPAVLIPKLCWSPRLTNSQPSSSDMFSMSWAVRRTWSVLCLLHLFCT